jgi:hypothetical protein
VGDAASAPEVTWQRVLWRTALVAVVAGVLLGALTTLAQPRSTPLRLALLPQWVVNQHRPGLGPPGAGPPRPELGLALDRGVVDRVVFGGERGAIPREWLFRKPIRIVTGPEGLGLGARGDFDLATVRPPAGPAAWTQLDVVPRTARPDDVLVLEVGGELGTLGQVLEAIIVFEEGRGPVELGLAPAALIGGAGVPVLQAPFGRPVSRPDAARRFQGTGGVEFLVIRSLVEAMVDAAVTPRGLADASPHWAGGWREADRVFLRLSGATLAATPPRVVLSWKDRVSLSPLGGDR